MNKILYAKGNYKYLILLIFTALQISVSGQNIIQLADTTFKKKDYFIAIEYYKKALTDERFKPHSTYLYFMLGESYRNINNYNEAVKYYKKSWDNGNKTQQNHLNLAEMLLMSGNPIEAKELFLQYKNMYKDRDIEKKINSCNEAIKLQNETPYHYCINLTAINSKYSDYAPVLLSPTQLLFTSSRIENETKLYAGTGQAYSDFYESTFNTVTKQWNTPYKSIGGLNTAFNDGTLSFLASSKIVYFMQCNGEKGVQTNCFIYTSQLKNDNTWEQAVMFQYHNPDFSIGHPTINSKGDILYFVSKMPINYGGSDIWMIRKDSTNTWGLPVNIGKPVNTSGNELFPFIYADTLLFFSSTEHNSIGGLDIFYSKTDDGITFSKPVRLGTPFNYTSDDFGIYLITPDSGYFSSNRPGGIGDDDIYMFHPIPYIYNLIGTVKHHETKQVIDKTSIILKASTGFLDSTTTNSNGIYQFSKLKPNTQYTITAYKQGYLKDIKYFTTGSERTNKVFSSSTGYDVDFSLIQIQEKKEIIIPNIYYDYNSWEIRIESEVALNELVKLLLQNPNQHIQIQSHTDERGSAEYNKTLSEKRAKAVVDYLVKNNVNPARLSFKGFGAENPIVKNAINEEEHQKNRRTSFSIIQ
ncbi:MAG: OmpA family protein [Bacteroidales bacterium]